ncbi:putative transcriptional regulatory protein PB1A11.04c like [Verticillium longisporum]|nr:putative transcriptional regulatory protein PB1A11.04c like [Verticillium longisporum]
MTRRDTFRRHMALHGLTVSSNRAPQACLPCRQAKVKCDGQRPACSTCSARSLRCGWSSRSNRTASNDAPATTPQAWKTTNGNSSMRIIEELESSDNYECGGPEDQQSMALSDPNAECPGKRLMYDKLLAIYFDKFHHHWPIIHRELTLSRSVPQVLLRTVVTVGLHLSGNLEAKALANSTLERFLEQSGTTLVSIDQLLNHDTIASKSTRLFNSIIHPFNFHFTHW